MLFYEVPAAQSPPKMNFISYKAEVLRTMVCYDLRGSDHHPYQILQKQPPFGGCTDEILSPERPKAVQFVPVA